MDRVREERWDMVYQEHRDPQAFLVPQDLLGGAVLMVEEFGMDLDYFLKQKRYVPFSFSGKIVSICYGLTK